ncbi:MAG: tyrosine-type recombinase/integrase, partial [Candidatus Deferrimicrobiaceae bacterium]
PSTQHGVRLILDKALIPEFGSTPIDKITREDVKTFAYRMLETDRVKEKKLTDGSETNTLSRSAVMGMGRTLSAIFNHAIEDGIITSNPAQRPGRYIRTGDRREKIDFLTPEEGRALLEAAKGHHPRNYPILATALYTGARQGELLALQWGDIDWHGKFIEIRRANSGLRQIRFHDLRHTFASWLIANGESLAYVKDQMGHHSIQITVDTYGHLIPGRTEKRSTG